MGEDGDVAERHEIVDAVTRVAAIEDDEASRLAHALSCLKLDVDLASVEQEGVAVLEREAANVVPR